MSLRNETAEFDLNSSSTAAPEEDCWSTLQCQLETTRFIVQKILVPLIVTFGVLGNAVTVAVLTRPWMKSSTNSYLTALAVYDLLYLVLNCVLDCVLDSAYDLYLVCFLSDLYLLFLAFVIERVFHIIRLVFDPAVSLTVTLTLTFFISYSRSLCHSITTRRSSTA